MILVDSSGWVEYLVNRSRAGRFATYIEGREPLLISATIAPVDEPLALEAADVSLAHGLAMADSLVYATARRFQATLVTGDRDFEGLPGAIVVR